MMASCEIINCPKTEDAARKVWAEDFGPLLYEYLEREELRTGETHMVDVRGFMMAWEQNGIRVILARDKGEPCGFMITNTYMPLFNPFPVMIVDKWMSDNEETERDLFEYLDTIIKMTGITHVHVATHDGQRLPEWVNTVPSDSYLMKRLEV